MRDFSFSILGSSPERSTLIAHTGSSAWKARGMHRRRAICDRSPPSGLIHRSGAPTADSSRMYGEKHPRSPQQRGAFPQRTERISIWEQLCQASHCPQQPSAGRRQPPKPSIHSGFLGMPALPRLTSAHQTAPRGLVRPLHDSLRQT